MEFGDSYKALPKETRKGPASESSAKKKGRIVVITTEDMHKIKNDVKARTTLLLALPNEHQLRFSKDDLNTMSLDDVYNHLKVYKPEVQKKSESNSQNMAFISSSNTSSGKGEVHTASVPTASIQVSTTSTDVAAASLSHDTVCAYIAFQSNGSQIKYEDITQIDEDDIEEIDIKWNMALLSMRADRFWKKTGKKITIQGSDVAGLPEFVDDTITDYSRPTPSIDESKCNKSDLQSNNFSISEYGESSGSIMSKHMIKFVKAVDCPRVTKTNNTENARKSTVKYAEMYRNTSKSPKVRGNQRNWNNLKSQQLGKDFLMQNKACFKCGYFDHLASDCGVRVEKGKTWPKNNFAHRYVTPRAVLLKTGKTPIAGEGSAIPTEPHHTPSPQEHHSPQHDSPPLSHLTITSEQISQAPTEPHTHRQYTRRATRIAQSKALSLATSALPYESSPRVTSFNADEGNQDLEISGLKARFKSLEDKERRGAEPTQEDALITWGIMEIEEELGADKSTKLGRNDTEEMVNVLISMEAANILTSRVAAASVSPVVGVSAAGVPTVSGSFPTVSAIFTTASVVTPYLKRPRGITIGGAQHMRSLIIGEKIKANRKWLNLKRRNEGLDKSNEVIAKHLQEYEQAAADLSVGEKIELISELVKGMTLEQIKEKFIPIWKQLEDFVHVSSKKEGERVKMQRLKIDQGSSKRMKTSEGISEEEIKGMMQLVPLEEVYVKALQFDREDLHQLWTLVKETFSIRHATKDKEKELWVELKRLFKPDFEDQLWIHNQAFMHDPLDWKLYDTCGVHHVFTKDQEIFMLVEKGYPLRRGLATVMICNKLQVEQYSQMANDLILKIHNIGNSPR
nr:ribonuclease H-like domain-containing protein [Tanacetum cinerariifolium]